MFHFSAAELDQFIAEDNPAFDLTTFAVTEHDPALRQRPATIRYVTRCVGVACGGEEVAAMLRQLGGEPGDFLASGTAIEPGDVLFTGRGPAEAVYTLWKVGQNVFDRASGVATRAALWVSTLRDAGYDCPVLTTRKFMPGTKKLVTKAVVSGGAVPHRLGVSETILIFDHHINLMGGVDVLIQQLPAIRRAHVEKKIVVESETLENARRYLTAGADAIQFDKVAPGDLGQWIAQLRSEFPDATFLAAGGVTFANAVEYAACGVDGLVTSALYQAPPLDIGVRIEVG